MRTYFTGGELVIWNQPGKQLRILVMTEDGKVLLEKILETETDLVIIGDEEKTE